MPRTFSKRQGSPKSHLNSSHTRRDDEEEDDEGEDRARKPPERRTPASDDGLGTGARLECEFVGTALDVERGVEGIGVG